MMRIDWRSLALMMCLTWVFPAFAEESPAAACYNQAVNRLAAQGVLLGDEDDPSVWAACKASNHDGDQAYHALVPNHRQAIDAARGCQAALRKGLTRDRLRPLPGVDLNLAFLQACSRSGNDPTVARMFVNNLFQR